MMHIKAPDSGPEKALQKWQRELSVKILKFNIPSGSEKHTYFVSVLYATALFRITKTGNNPHVQ